MIEPNEEFWDFVENNLNSDPSALRLKYYGKADIPFDVGFAIIQIECRRKFSKKLADTLAAFPRFLFPSVLAGEQATSDRFARFHASLLNNPDSLSDINTSGSLTDSKFRVADLTSGLGIDVFHLARIADEVYAVELDAQRAACLRYNANGLNLSNITVVEGDCRDFLAESAVGMFDAVFIDPARRAADGSRVYALSDCQPDVVAMMPRLREIADRAIVKMSPMLDISHVVNELPSTTRIIALGSTTECRELVAIVRGGQREHLGNQSFPTIEAVTLTDNGPKLFSVDCDSETASFNDSTVYAMPAAGDFLFEPSPAVMKVGHWHTFAERYGLKMLSANSHLFFRKKDEADLESATAIPASQLIVQEVLPYQSKIIKRFKKDYPKISITCRNFDVASEMLRKKLGVTDGGSLRLFATKDSGGNPQLIIARPC